MYSLRLVEAYQDPDPQVKDSPMPRFVSLVAFKRAGSYSEK